MNIKETRTYEVDNPGSCLGQAQKKCRGLNWLMGSQTLAWDRHKKNVEG